MPQMGTPLMAAEAHPAVEDARNPWPLLGFLLSVGVVALDQLTKWLVLGVFGEAPFTDECRLLRGGSCGGVEVSSVVDLTMVWNRGVSFGLLQADGALGRWGLVGFTLVVAGLLGYWLARTRRPFAAIALGCVIGGAVGNLIDRVAFGAVVDFIDFSGPWFGWTIGGWNVGFPWVFNVADAAINVGAAFLVLEIVLERRPAR
jgi:signal peptidase II